MKGKFFITTPIYYVNDLPHIGHAYTTIAADVLARFYRLRGRDVFLLTGTDEHGLKIQHKAEEAGKEPQKFVDEIAEEFKKLWNKLNIECDNFIRTTNPTHEKAVQKVLQILYDKKAIYKGEYEGIYCVACEQFKSESELIEGRCPDHDIVVERIKEECYLLRMADLQEELIEKIEEREFRIEPERYRREVLSFLKSEKLQDISISRKNVKWGVPLPFDAKHTTYVWVDAFLNYLTGLGWNGDVSRLSSGDSQDLALKFWPPDVQLIGKDILRVHATIWPIILMHLGIELPKMLFVHGHILSGGRKMSKTVGNVIPIDEMLQKFGVDGTRYLLLAAGTFGEDVDVTAKRLTEKYNADLANGLGNLVSRVVKLISNFKFQILNFKSNPNVEISNFIERLELDNALEYVWKIVREDNKYIELNKPWELVKIDRDRFHEIMQKLISDLYVISELIIPFMPKTSKRIKEVLETKKAEILFPRVK